MVQSVLVEDFHYNLGVIGFCSVVGLQLLCCLIAFGFRLPIRFTALDALHKVQRQPSHPSGGIVSLGAVLASLLLCVYALYDSVNVFNTLVRFTAQRGVGIQTNRAPYLIRTRFIGLIPSACHNQWVSAESDGFRCAATPTTTVSVLERNAGCAVLWSCPSVATFTKTNPNLVVSISANYTDAPLSAVAIAVRAAVPHFRDAEYYGR